MLEKESPVIPIQPFNFTDLQDMIKTQSKDTEGKKKNKINVIEKN